MLKFILATIMITFCVKNWLRVQLRLLLFRFLFGLFSIRGFIIRRLGSIFGLDYIRYILILLRFWIIALVVGASQKISLLNNFPQFFLLTSVFLLLSLVLTFSCLDYLLFYVCFERSLIPTLILILGWGYQPERLQAGIYILFYTLFGSLPLLISLLSLYRISGTITLSLFYRLTGSSSIIIVWYLCRVFAFIVKLPIFLVHLWLPKAHVEAPVAGSIILAGVLLKLGGYGLIRLRYIFTQAAIKFNWIWLSLGLIGGALVRVICLRQTDIKALIAYSSVAHIGLVLCGLVLFNWWGLGGAMAVIVGHGLCSSGLFCLSNIVYERLGRRRLLVSKGLLRVIPSLALWWFLLSVGNMAAPPTLNLLGEISLITRVVSWRSLSIAAICFLSFLRAAYRLYLFSLRQHGKFYSSLFSCCSGKVREYLILLLHWLPLNVLILSGPVIIMYLNSLSIKILVCGANDVWLYFR